MSPLEACNTERPTVLILDDEAMVRMNLAAFLQDEDFETLEADTTDKAFEQLEQHSVDLVVVDLRLPSMDGSQFIEVAYHKYPELKFLIHTGSVEYSISKRLMEFGLRNEDILYKPVMDMGVFVQRINDRIAKKF